MARWISMINLRGTYTSPPLPIPLSCDGALTKIAWDYEAPDNTQVIVQTRVSFDGGYSWTEWMNCVNGGQIPDINEETGLYGASIIYRVLMQSKAYDYKPKFKNLTFYFEPVMVFDNKGDLPCNPEIWITKKGNGDFSIINLTHNNEEFKFSSLIDGETVFVDNENQDIETSLVVTYRYKDFNDNYLSFPVGKNILRVNGKADIKFRYQFKLLQ